MAENNATNLIFLSRHAGVSPSDKAFFDELQNQGCSLSIIKGSVRHMSDVEDAISSASKPLRGVFDLSMVLQDESLLRMSLDEWDTAIGPKVQGTWNLHKACVDHELDFFMLFSSMCGIIGMPGQANCATANTFLDSFVQYHKFVEILKYRVVRGLCESGQARCFHLSRLRTWRCAYTRIFSMRGERKKKRAFHLAAEIICTSVRSVSPNRVPLSRLS